MLLHLLTQMLMLTPNSSATTPLPWLLLPWLLLP